MKKASEGQRFYGKYRGTVFSTVDPENLGRIQALVPDVYGPITPSGWALPCAVFAGIGCGVCAVPPMGAKVWIEFEQGDIDYPIWTGCFWDSSAGVIPPPDGFNPPPFSKFVIRTQAGNALILDHEPGFGGITLQSMTGQKLYLSAQGVMLQDELVGAASQMVSITPAGGITIQTPEGASVQLLGPKVSINQSALEVI
jgi:uncharacterized protein involved in type VI secretion and phage assembly